MARGNNAGGRLRIGDHWSAISIIAQSQDNPLKAVAEFVENSIDARARNIDIVRGRERGQPYLKIVDDGEGVRRDKAGAPDFHYVATHICDSIKKRLKREGAKGNPRRIRHRAVEFLDPWRKPEAQFGGIGRYGA
ncbi:MAG: ATP-binding protein [Gammaproteobacteria bacterium]|nr:ATP-binding protein [Gammaproteobacteria bacterium]